MNGALMLHTVATFVPVLAGGTVVRSVELVLKENPLTVLTDKVAAVD